MAVSILSYNMLYIIVVLANIISEKVIEVALIFLVAQMMEI